jgi:CheY-like chemotaxis protein
VGPLLGQWGHSVVVAHNGREAVALSEARPFDVILMDVQMPEMNGLDATAAIRAREGATGGHVPIVAMTAHAMASDREQCLDAGMDAYVSKPLRAGDLFETIEAIASGLDDEEARAPAPAGGAEADVLDTATIVANFGGSHRVVREVIDVFLADSGPRLAAIRQAAADNDAAGLANAAHALKGSVGLFSRGRTFEAARHIETTARAGDLPDALEAVGRLEAAVPELQARLRAVRDSLNPARPAPR